jgi:hypothetical protein
VSKAKFFATSVAPFAVGDFFAAAGRVFAVLRSGWRACRRNDGADEAVAAEAAATTAVTTAKVVMAVTEEAVTEAAATAVEGAAAAAVATTGSDVRGLIVPMKGIVAATKPTAIRSIAN